MHKSLTILFACSVSVSGPALAANVGHARAELRGGWDRTTLGLSYSDETESVSASDHKDGFNLGAEVGYDVHFGRALVAGAYAGIEGATTKTCSPVFGDDSACLKLGRNLTVGGRIGAQVSPLAMIYVKAGYSYGQLRATYANADDPTLDFKAHSNRGGVHFGIGGEMAIGPMTYARIEYVRTNYNDYDYVDPDFRVTLDGHRDQALVGFGVRF